jgi:hypothetical protein
MNYRIIKTCGCLVAVVAALLLNTVRILAAEDEQPSADPLGDISQDMKVASHWLAKSSTDVLTQETQQDAVHKLDVLIAALEKQRQQMGNGRANMNPTQPMQDSRVKAGPGGMGKLHSANDEGKKWAELPPHERERILQSMTDGFPSHYQGVLEQYFKRLAEEQPVKADEQASPATSNTSASNSPTSNPPTADSPAAAKSPPANETSTPAK